jgi:two-component system, chemotaxis family, CheB/CheR fusion protein
MNANNSRVKKKKQTRTESRVEPKAVPGSVQPKLTESFPIVGVGASAGGLEAFSELLRCLPEKIGMAFVLVQHLDPSHLSMLQEILSRTSRMPVKEVTDGMVVEPDHVYVMPANSQVEIKRNVLHLGARSFERGLHMPINSFFASLAAARAHGAIGVILSGTASDGTEGCAAIKAAGGVTFAQDVKTAKYDSMPRSAISAGCIDFVRSPEGIVKELLELSRHPYVLGAVLGREKTPPLAPESDWAELLALVRDATGVDFLNYKQTTLQRRIRRRMILHKIEGLREYLAFVKSSPGELDELYKDVLIHVTGFFRDPGAFDALRELVFPNLFRRRKAEEGPVRIWIPGCSTGEEVYSIAIVLLEYLHEESPNVPLVLPNPKKVQFFATDISDTALDRARRGLYTEAAVAEVSAERLREFFARVDGGYQINKALREMCIFARQNLTKDPPFSNIDLISCRNLLIYLGPVLQNRVIPALHYALKPEGYLMLGGSESLGGFADHFTLIDKKYKVYRKTKVATRLITYFTGAGYSVRRPDETRKLKPSEAALTVEKEVERLLLKGHMPPSIVVNDQMEIVQIHGRTGDFLEPAPGHPTFSLSKMAREGLLVDLRSALSKAKKENGPVLKEGIFVKSNGSRREVDVEVVPFRVQDSNERLYLVIFRNPLRKGPLVVEKGKHPAKAERGESQFSRENKRLERDVAQLREQLQSLIEEHETTLEEFKSANEEVLSANEELQSTNEELETAKEELQSSNEELATVNEELQNRNAELMAANNDLLNLLGNVNIPVVMVGGDLRIRRFTPAAERLLNLIPADIGRHLGEVRPNIDVDDLENLVRETVDTATLHEHEVREQTGAWHMLRVRPYKTGDNKIDGAVLTFLDIDAFKRNLDLARKYTDALLETARESILVLDGDLRVVGANPAFFRTFKPNTDDVIGRYFFQVDEGRWNLPKLRSLLEDITRKISRIDDFEMHISSNREDRLMVINARRIDAEAGRPLILLAIEDDTEKRKQIDSVRMQAALLELAHDAVLVRSLDGKIQFWNRGAEEMYGWTKEEALGKMKLELLQPKLPKSWKELEGELLKHGYWEGEVTHVRRDGSRLIVQSRWALRREAKSSVVLEINSDITAKKRSEENLRKLSTYLIRLQDEERRRIARELHDSTGQKLILLKMNLEALTTQLDADPRKVPRVSESIKLVDEATQEIRTLSQLLHPPLLDEAGLAVAAKWLIDGFSERSGIKVNFHMTENLGRLPQNVEIALFRITQEALNNIHRHSGADKAEVSVSEAHGQVTLKIADNGSGFRPGLHPSELEASPPVGVGIQGMKERLSQLGGTLEITSGKKGTTITAKVPHQNHPDRG